MTSLNPSLRSALINKSRKQKNALEKGFSLVELMVTDSVIGVLSAVALPKLAEAQKQGAANAALQEAVNAGKSCTLAITRDAASSYTSPAKTTGKVTGDAVACADDAAFAYTGGDVTWTVTMDDGVATDPVDS